MLALKIQRGPQKLEVTIVGTMHPASGVKTEELEAVGIPLGRGKSV